MSDELGNVWTERWHREVRRAGRPNTKTLSGDVRDRGTGRGGEHRPSLVSRNLSGVWGEGLVRGAVVKGELEASLFCSVRVLCGTLDRACGDSACRHIPAAIEGFRAVPARLLCRQMSRGIRSTGSKDGATIWVLFGWHRALPL